MFHHYVLSRRSMVHDRTLYQPLAIIVPPRTPHLPRPHLLCIVRLLPQVLPERLLVLVSCVHVPMPLPHADGLPHDAVRTHIVVESVAVITPQPSSQDHRQVLHQDHRSVHTVLAPDGYRHGQGRHQAVPPLVYRFDQRLHYLVGDVVRASPHQTATLAAFLRLRRRRPPPTHRCRRHRGCMIGR